jgi:hypothetical protein
LKLLVNYLTVTHDHPVPGAVFLRDAFYRVNRAGQHDLEPIYERIDSDVLGDKRLRMNKRGDPF